MEFHRRRAIERFNDRWSKPEDRKVKLAYAYGDPNEIINEREWYTLCRMCAMRDIEMYRGYRKHIVGSRRNSQINW
jgi:hypothetical protein